MIEIDEVLQLGADASNFGQVFLRRAGYVSDLVLPGSPTMPDEDDPDEPASRNRRRQRTQHSCQRPPWETLTSPSNQVFARNDDADHLRRIGVLTCHGSD